MALMSDLYVRRMEKVFLEFEATREAIGYVERNWQRQSISFHPSRSGFADLL